MPRRARKRRQIPAADRGSRPDPLQAGVRRRDLRGSALARARLGRSRCWSSRSARRLMPARSTDLRARGLAYACFCTRADIAQSLTAPHGDAATSYPGHLPRRCPTIPSGARRRRIAGGSIRPRRSRLAGLAQLARSRRRAASAATADDIGDAILARKDAPASYHLSCVVDDAASGVTMVVRGADLRASTPIQRLLQAAARPARADLSAPSRSSPMTTAAASPSATSRRRSPRCARAASTGRRSPRNCSRGKLPLWLSASGRLNRPP